MDTAIRIACIAFSLLSGCQRAPDFAEMPVDDTHRAAAVAAANTLRERFNRGACQTIYDDAGEFFRSQSPRRWLTDCEGLRAVRDMGELHCLGGDQMRGAGDHGLSGWTG